MTLSLGTGPFGHDPAGAYNRPMPDTRGLIYLETFHRRIRGRLGGEIVVDSVQPKLLHEHGQLPVLYFPAGDVRTDLLEPTDHRTHSPWQGDASTGRCGGRARTRCGPAVNRSKETGLPPRWYLPAEDMRDELLEPSETTSICSYKGFARYRSARVGGELVEDVAWSYDEPRHDADRVAGYVCFYNERVDLDLDEEREERPVTPFSQDAPPVYAGLWPQR